MEPSLGFPKTLLRSVLTAPLVRLNARMKSRSARRVPAHGSRSKKDILRYILRTCIPCVEVALLQVQKYIRTTLGIEERLARGYI